MIFLIHPRNRYESIREERITHVGNIIEGVFCLFDVVALIVTLLDDGDEENEDASFSISSSKIHGNPICRET